jgi:hypothetical protein
MPFCFSLYVTESVPVRRRVHPAPEPGRLGPRIETIPDGKRAVLECLEHFLWRMLDGTASNEIFGRSFSGTWLAPGPLFGEAQGAPASYRS